jgi:hypothetical protein
VGICPITLGEIQGSEAVIKTGLTPGVLVVVDGAERLSPGAKVELKAPASQPSRRNS